MQLATPLTYFYFLGTIKFIWGINPFKDSGEVDYSASAFDVQKLVRHEQKLIKLMYKYKSTLNGQLGLIERYLEDFESSTRDTINPKKIEFDKEKAIEISKHALKTYRLIRRFVKNFAELEDSIENDSSPNGGFLDDVANLKKLLKFPTEKDLEGSILSIIRLKQTYDISMADLVEGNFVGIRTNSGLTAENCFEIGQKALEQEVFSTAIGFFDMGLQLMVKTKQIDAQSEDYAGKVKLLEEIIKKHDEFLTSGKFDRDDNPYHFTSALNSYNHKNFSTRTLNTVPFEPEKVTSMKTASAAFEKLCRCEEIRNTSTVSKLKCLLISDAKTHPFYVLNPLQVEFQNINPPIVQIYNVLSEKQMNAIKEEAQPELSRSRILTMNKGNSSSSTKSKTSANTTYFRTSSNTWIFDGENGGPFDFVNQITERITGLNIKPYTAREILQIANYATGGYYTSHYDAVHEPSILAKLNPEEFVNGDRIATFMVYLSDVDLGGGTAFPILGVSIKPIKGSAVFWYNLHTDGSINRKTLHGGCPVLYGNKWVANKWIRANDQMFVRKCPQQQTKDVWL